MVFTYNEKLYKYQDKDPKKIEWYMLKYNNGYTDDFKKRTQTRGTRKRSRGTC